MKSTAMYMAYHIPAPRGCIALCCALLMPSGAQAKDIKNVSTESERSTLSQSYVTVNGEVQSNGRAEILFREQLARGATNSPQFRNAEAKAVSMKKQVRVQ